MLAAPSIGSSTGPPQDNLESNPTIDFGCTCHGGGNPSTAVEVAISAVPQAYEAGQAYNFTITLKHDSNAAGGFLMSDRGVGTFTLVDGIREAEDDPDSISHSAVGNNWVVQWTAPEVDVGEIYFTLVGNSVNENNNADEFDAWNILNFIIAAPGTATVSSDEGLSLRTISVGDYDSLFAVKKDSEAARQEQMAKDYFDYGNLYYWTTLSIIIIAAVVQGEFYERRFGGGPEHLDMRLAVPQGIRRGILFAGLTYAFVWSLQEDKPYGWPLLLGMLALWAGYGVYRTYCQANAPLRTDDML